MSVLTAIVVAGSIFISFPAGIARVYPVQHAVNVIAAILLGPFPAIVIAFMTGLVRIRTGTGSLLAFPGGMIGAAFAGWLYKRTRQIWLAALGEIIGTGIIASRYLIKALPSFQHLLLNLDAVQVKMAQESPIKISDGA
jgi:energy coupling factor transporter S component ThiW